MESSDWSSLGSSVIGGVSTIIGSSAQVKSARAQAEAIATTAQANENIAQSQIELEKVKGQNALALLNASQSKGGGNNTLYIGLAVGGVLVLGLVVFAVTRK